MGIETERIWPIDKQEKVRICLQKKKKKKKEKERKVSVEFGSESGVSNEQCEIDYKSSA
jgi:hypothetical protein